MMERRQATGANRRRGPGPGAALALATIALAAAGLAPGPARGQSQQQQPSAGGSRQVSLIATVRNKHGKILNNVSPGDLVLKEDGRPQTIASLSRNVDMPLTVGLLVDTSSSQSGTLADESAASYSFLNRMLRERDQAFVFHFDREVELLQNVTGSRIKLEAAFKGLGNPELVRTEEERRDRGVDQVDAEPRRAPGRVGGTALYDAIFLASDEIIWRQPGRRALVVLSDGLDLGSSEDLQGAIQAAQRAGAAVYAIFSVGQGHEALNRSASSGRGNGGRGGRGKGDEPRAPEERADGRRILQYIADETGGQLIDAGKRSLNEAYHQIEEDLRNQYSVAYAPDKIAPGYHMIQLTARQKGLTVQVQRAYYSR